MYVNKISHYLDDNSIAVLSNTDNIKFLDNVSDNSIDLIVTSPPYNMCKKYETKLSIEEYIRKQNEIISICYKKLKNTGSICWQVGSIVNRIETLPIDIILFPLFKEKKLFLKNRIIWTFGHGLHAKKKFSGRYETILWFTKSEKNYVFNLDPVRVPQKYPMKKYSDIRRKGNLSCNPLGKNPSDVWDIPNVKNNHIEKTNHPCQFPVGMIERLVLALTNEGDSVFDPFSGSGSSVIAAVKNKRRGIGCEINRDYYTTSVERVLKLFDGTLKTRPMNKETLRI